jgi:glycogen synthase
MKLALLSYEYPPDTGYGGIGTYTWHHGRALARLGHEVHVIAGAPTPKPLSSTRQDGVTVWRARDGGSAALCARALNRMRLWWTANRLENAVTMARAVRRLQREHRFDALEMPECGAEGLFVCRLAEGRTVVRFHSPARLIMPLYDLCRADRLLCAGLEAGAMRHASALTSCSRFLRDAAHRELGLRREIAVIPNGIDLEWFDGEDSPDVRREAGVDPHVPVVLFPGRMERRKGVHLLPDIAAQILERHEVALVLVGRDIFGYVEQTLLPALRQRRLRGSIHFLGGLDLSRVRSWMRTADVVLLPSLWESCPYTCLEAMAAGRAILASDAGGLPELVRDGANGLVAPSGDSAAFVSQLERLLGDSSLRRRLGVAARRTVETDLRSTAIAERTVAVYRGAA